MWRTGGMIFTAVLVLAWLGAIALGLHGFIKADEHKHATTFSHPDGTHSHFRPCPPAIVRLMGLEPGQKAARITPEGRGKFICEAPGKAYD